MSAISWLTTLIFARVAISILVVVVFLAIGKHNRAQFRELGLALFLSVVADVVGIAGHYFFRVNSNLVGNIYVVLASPLYLIFYKKQIHWRGVAGILNLLIAGFLVFSVINFRFIQGPTNIDSYTIATSSIILTGVSVFYFYVLIRELPTESITKLPMFWINTAILIYNSGSIIVWLSADYLINVLKDNMIISWIVYQFVSIAHYILIMIGLWMIRSTRAVSVQ